MNTHIHTHTHTHTLSLSHTCTQTYPISLVIEDVNRDHSGVYVCRATNPKINDPQKANSFSEEAIVKIESRNSQQKTPIRQGQTINDLGSLLYIVLHFSLKNIYIYIYIYIYMHHTYIHMMSYFSQQKQPLQVHVQSLLSFLLWL